MGWWGILDLDTDLLVERIQDNGERDGGTVGVGDDDISVRQPQC